jgi:hypothetical protein
MIKAATTAMATAAHAPCPVDSALRLRRPRRWRRSHPVLEPEKHSTEVRGRTARSRRSASGRRPTPRPSGRLPRGTGTSRAAGLQDGSELPADVYLTETGACYES